MSATSVAQRMPLARPNGGGLSDFSDETLAALAREGHGHAVHELLNRYRGFAQYKASSYFVAGGDQDDVIQEGMIGLYKAIRDYNPDRGASLRTFADLCITRQILTAVRRARRQKHAPLNTSVPIDAATDRDTPVPREAVEDHGTDDPLQRLVVDHDVRRLRSLCEEVLSELECSVLQLVVEGRSYREIAGQLDCDVKCVDNAIQRIRRKLEERLPAASG